LLVDDADAPAMARPRVAAGALIRDPHGRILVVKPSYKDGWDLPGGYVEPGESPAAACRRELREELSLDRIPGRLLVVDWAPHPIEGDKLLFVFDCGTLAGASKAEPDGIEIVEAQFVAIAHVKRMMLPRLARRITVAVAGPLDAYAEHGMAVTSAHPASSDS
jgi:8-oxo-dGTP diphosphatase